MNEAKRQWVQSWLIKAKHDLAAADKLVADSDPLLDTAIYHCQQAAEKSIKGFLAFHDQPLEKTHNIETLLKLAVPYEAKFSRWLSIANRMTEYTFAFRYPDVVMEPARAECEQAMENAANIYAFVLSVLPAETHP